MLRKVLLAVACAGISSLAAAQVHKWVDANGVTHYGDAPPANRSATKVKIAKAPPPPPPREARPMNPAGVESPAKPKSDPAAKKSEPDLVTRMQAQASERARARAIEQCKSNRGVDCESAKGIDKWQAQEQPLSASDRQQAIAGRIQRQNCARAPGALGC